MTKHKKFGTKSAIFDGKRPNRVSFREQLKHCKEKGFLFTEQYPMAVRYLISCCRIFGGQCMSSKCRGIRAKGNKITDDSISIWWDKHEA